jgi:hypothetical protein
MKRGSLSVLVCIAACILYAGVSHAALLNFDDLATSGTDFIYMTDYSNSGFTLTGGQANALSCPKMGNNFFYFGSANLSNRFFNGITTLTSSNGSFTIESMDLHFMYYPYVATTVEFYAYSGNTQVGYLNYTLNASPFNWQPVNFGVDFENITSLKWAQGSTVDNAYLFDNIVAENTSPVPVPAAILLLGSGLLGLAASRKKIKK